MYSTRLAAAFVIAVCSLSAGIALPAEGVSRRAEDGARAAPAAGEPQLGPEQKMARRFPQPVRAGDLLGLPLLDDDDRTLGHVTGVVRTAEGRIVLVTTWGSWFGFGGRPVGIPLETVAILGRQIDVLDLSREEVAALPRWDGHDAASVPADETLRIAISRR